MSEEPNAPTNDDGSREREEAILAEMEAKLVEIQAVAAEATEARKKITDDQVEIATQSAAIKAALKHGEDVGTTLDSKLAAAEVKIKEAEGLKDRAQAAADQAVNLKAEIVTTKGSAEAALERISKAEDTGKESADLTKDLADKSVAVEAKIAEYEEDLAKLGEQYTTLVERIEGLLPGATSAGLATVYSKRADQHKPLKNLWQGCFLGSLAFLFAIAVFELWQIGKLEVTPSYDELFRRFLNRLPLVAPVAIVVWYAALRAAQSRQLEEEYAFKAATAASFDGFAKMMTEIPGEPDGEHPRRLLAANVLRILAASPQRIFHRDQSKELPTGKVMGEITGLPAQASLESSTKKGIWSVVAWATIIVVLIAILTLLVVVSIKGTLFTP